jgi:hypothetical protein
VAPVLLAALMVGSLTSVPVLAKISALSVLWSQGQNSASVLLKMTLRAKLGSGGVQERLAVGSMATFVFPSFYIRSFQCVYYGDQ